MAVLASVTKMDTFHPAVELVRGTCTTTGDTYVSRIKKIQGVIISDETTVGVSKATFSGQTVTVTTTGGDVVNLLIWGLP